MVSKAIVFATKAHEGQFRKATKIPYILHPMECAVIISGMTTDEEMIAAALLHDTVEDCDVTIEDIRREFGSRVAQFVARESEDKSKSWQERKQTTIDQLSSHTKEECMLVLADKLSNIRSITRDYKELGEALWDGYHEKRKERIGWYYKSIAEKLTCLSEYEQYAEYCRLVEQIFE